MPLELLLTALPVLNLDVGQAYEIVARMECKVDDAGIDLNGAASTSAIGGGKKTVTLIFTKKWPADLHKEIGVLAFETSGKETTLQELTYGQESVPTLSDVPQAPMAFQGGATVYSLSSQYGPGNALWNYEEVQVLVHGAVRKYRGVCTLTAAGAR
jgi:hypothetical protein